MKPLGKHNALQHAWLDGAKIQKERIDFDADHDDYGNTYWLDEDNPNWDEGTNYRIKPAEPEKVYPVTNMTLDELKKALHGNPMTGFVDHKLLANAAIRRAIDDGQVVIADFENTWKVKAYEEWMEKTNWVQSNSSHFNFNATGMHRADVMKREIELLRANRDGRDMAIAKAVRTHCSHWESPSDLMLSKVIAGVK